MTTLAVTLDELAFDYSSISSTAATILQAQAGRIRKTNKSVMTSIIGVGKELIAARTTLPHGRFQDWVETECGFSVRTAENYIRATQFAEGKNATVAHLSPGVVYKLAAKGTPTDIVDAVLQRASKGEIITDRAVSTALATARREKFDAHKKQREQKRRQVSAKTRRRWEIERAHQEEQERRDRERRQEAVARVLDRFGIEEVRFLVDALGAGDSWEMMRLLAEAVHGAAPAEAA